MWLPTNFLTVLSTATIDPILKGFLYPSLLKSYRSISLLSVICKVLEKIVNGGLQRELEGRKPLFPVKCGFWCSRSTLDQILFLQNNIIVSFTKSSIYCLPLFDFKNSFGLIRRHKITNTHTGKIL